MSWPTIEARFEGRDLCPTDGVERPFLANVSESEYWNSSELEAVVCTIDRNEGWWRGWLGKRGYFEAAEQSKDRGYQRRLVRECEEGPAKDFKKGSKMVEDGETVGGVMDDHDDGWRLRTT